jgi:hypothetical protein
MNAKTLHIVSLVVLANGLIVGLLTLAAPAGVWLGLWDFRRGFAILQATFPFTSWIALLCLILAIVLSALAQFKNTGNTRKVASFAFAGALLVAISWYIPSTFEARLSYPRIHDVSTDVDNPPGYVAIAPLRADATNTMVYGAANGLEPGENARLQREGFPDLVPRLLDASPQEVFDRALAALQSMGLEIVAAVPEEGRIEATATTFWFRFKDDVVIRIQPQGYQTLIDARSLSRVGGGDAGTNGLRLREFFSLL